MAERLLRQGRGDVDVVARGAVAHGVDAKGGGPAIAAVALEHPHRELRRLLRVVGRPASHGRVDGVEVHGEPCQGVRVAARERRGRLAGVVPGPVRHALGSVLLVLGAVALVAGGGVEVGVHDVRAHRVVVPVLTAGLGLGATCGEQDREQRRQQGGCQGHQEPGTPPGMSRPRRRAAAGKVASPDPRPPLARGPPVGPRPRATPSLARPCHRPALLGLAFVQMGRTGCARRPNNGPTPV